MRVEYNSVNLKLRIILLYKHVFKNDLSELINLNLIDGTPRHVESIF